MSHSLICNAVFLGSSGSSGPGFLAVLTEQNLQPRVQVSPISMIVAVAVPSPPPQHSPTFGQRASSHTVASLDLRKPVLTRLNDSPRGISTKNEFMQVNYLKI